MIYSAIMTGKPPHGQKQGYGSAVRGQAALPYIEDFYGIGQIIVRLVKQAMPQAGTHQRPNNEGVEQGIQQLERYPFPFEEAFENVIPYGKGNNKK
ncbi:MAG: hypothetical protein BWX93_01789 [Bacteroidetes bacterium ADurb.Bin139]|nr:MAG: hypothetical protein BWX93_01789 [Bacteroidetes bacterium ADurb.Bin139]